MTISELARNFQNVRPLNNHSYQCRCPCHDDLKASLTISEQGGKILLHCHAGCDTGDILQAVGLTFSDIGEKKQGQQWMKRLEHDKKKKIEAVYDYTDEIGNYLYSKIRFYGKEILYGIKNGHRDSFTYGLNGRKKTLYKLPDVIKEIQKGFPVFITEGEKDADNLRKIGLCATTCGGCSDWRMEFAPYFTGASVILLPDYDKPGQEFMQRIKQSLRLYAHKVKIVITCRSDKGDVTDFLQQGGTRESLMQLIEKVPWSYAPWIFENNQKKLSVNEGQLAEAVRQTLPILVLGKKGQEKDLIYLFENGVYSECTKNRMKGYIRRYLPIHFVKDSLLNNTANLIGCPSDGILPYEVADSDEWFTNVKNGLVNVKTGELFPHDKNVISTIQLNCSFQSIYKPPKTFLGYIDDLCRDADGTVDESKKTVLQEWTGLILSNINVYRVKKCLVLYSLMGNTGKTQYFNLIGEIVGADNKASVPLQKMKERFELGNLYGKRLNLVGDQQADDIEDSSPFKSLTGGDDISVEPKGKQSYNYRFKGAMVFGCNNLPAFKDDKGGHIFERMTLIECCNVIPEHKRNPMILDHMLNERDGVYMWGLIGLRRLLQNNFKFSSSRAVNDSITGYRRTLDTFFAFVNENYDFTDNVRDRVKKSDLENEYQRWCQASAVRGLQKKNIQERAEKIGIPCGKVDGYWYYKKIKEKDFFEDADTFHQCTFFSEQREEGK